MISERISDDIPPQIKILNMVIPNLMLFYSLVSNLSVVSRIKPHKGVYHQIKRDVINDVKLFLTIYCRIYCRKLLRLSNQTSRYKSKCIRITLYMLRNFALEACLLQLIVDMYMSCDVVCDFQQCGILTSVDLD